MDTTLKFIRTTAAQHGFIEVRHDGRMENRERGLSLESSYMYGQSRARLEAFNPARPQDRGALHTWDVGPTVEQRERWAAEFHVSLGMAEQVRDDVMSLG